VPEDLTAAVIGLGYVGSCVAATLAERGLRVTGVDANAAMVDDLNNGICRIREPGLAQSLLGAIADGRVRVTTGYEAVSDCDVVLIAVGTPVHDGGSLDDRQLRDACRSLSRRIRPGQLVILKSTVPPGTTRHVVRPLLEQGGLAAGVDFMLAFAPERLAEGAAMAELRNLPIVVGGLDEPSTARAADFWRRALGVRVLPQDSLEAAEIVKLADNWWIDLNIALAHELAKFCAAYEVDVLDVVTAANSIPKGNGQVNILLPSVGVGGSCLTKDPWMVWRSGRSRGVLIETAPLGRKINDGMPAYTARIILDDLASRDREPARATVAVLGLAFKNNTGDLRDTPVRGVIAALLSAGVQVRAYDPLVDPALAKEVLGIRPAATLDEAVRGADCLAVLAYHREFHGIDFASLPVAPACLVFDGRAHFPKATIAALRERGFRYRGIGR
jgi:UDP-N-acetyl-D-mannosaminuronic acid dehydrogenase